MDRGHDADGNLEGGGYIQGYDADIDPGEGLDDDPDAAAFPHGYRIVHDPRFEYMTPQERSAMWEGREDIDVMTPDDVEDKVLDIAYGTEPGQLLDLYLPPEGIGPDRRPVIFYLHGGSWCAGDKAGHSLGSCLPGIKRGYCVIGVGYRLIPSIRFPEMLLDVKTAIRWARAHADEYSFDTSKFAIVGGSAGGYLALMAAITAGRRELEGYGYGWPGEDSHLQAVVSLYGVHDLLDDDEMYLESGVKRYAPATDPTIYDVMFGSDIGNLLALYSPVNMIPSDMPPTLIMHGRADPMVPYQQATLLHERIDEACGPGRSKLVLFDDYSHADIRFLSPGNVERILGFIDRSLGIGGNTTEVGKDA